MSVGTHARSRNPMDKNGMSSSFRWNAVSIPLRGREPASGLDSKHVGECVRHRFGSRMIIVDCALGGEVRRPRSTGMTVANDILETETSEIMGQPGMFVLYHDAGGK